jgi:hypothetical protein
MRKTPGQILEDVRGPKNPLPLDIIPSNVAGKPIKEWDEDDLGQINDASTQTVLALLHLRDKIVAEVQRQNFTRDTAWRLAKRFSELDSEANQNSTKVVPDLTKKLIRENYADVQAIINDPRARGSKTDFGAFEKLMAEMSQAAYLRPKADPVGARMRTYMRISGIQNAGYKHMAGLSSDLAQVFLNPETHRMTVAWRGSLSPISNPQDWIKNAINAVGLQKLASGLPGAQSRAEVAFGNRVVQYARENGYRIDTTGHSRGGASAGQFERAHPDIVDSVRTFNGAPFQGDSQIPLGKVKHFAISGDVVSASNQLGNLRNGLPRTIPPAHGRDPLSAHGIDQFTGLSSPTRLNPDGTVPSGMKITRPNDTPIEIRAPTATTAEIPKWHRAGAAVAHSAAGIGVGFLVTTASEALLEQFGFERGQNLGVDLVADGGEGALAGLLFDTPGSTAAGFIGYDAMHQLLRRLHAPNAVVAFGSAGAAVGAERLASMAIASAVRRFSQLAAQQATRAGFGALVESLGMAVTEAGAEAAGVAAVSAPETGPAAPFTAAVVGTLAFVGFAVADLIHMNAEDAAQAQRNRQEEIQKLMDDLYRQQTGRLNTSEIGDREFEGQALPVGFDDMNPSASVSIYSDRDTRFNTNASRFPDRNWLYEQAGISYDLAVSIYDISNDETKSTQEKTNLIRELLSPGSTQFDSQILQTFGQEALDAYNAGDPAWQRQSTAYQSLVEMLKAARDQYGETMANSGLMVPHVSEKYQTWYSDAMLTDAADEYFGIEDDTVGETDQAADWMDTYNSAAQANSYSHVGGDGPKYIPYSGPAPSYVI